MFGILGKSTSILRTGGECILAEEKKTSQTKTQSKAKNASNSNIIAALSYFWILSVVFYVTNKDDKFVVFHARQGMVLFAISLLVLFVFPVLGLVPFVGFLIMLVNLALFVAFVVGAIKAYQGEKYRFPLIADIAEKINF